MSVMSDLMVTKMYCPLYCPPVLSLSVLITAIFEKSRSMNLWIDYQDKDAQKRCYQYTIRCYVLFVLSHFNYVEKWLKLYVLHSVSLNFLVDPMAVKKQALTSKTPLSPYNPNPPQTSTSTTQTTESLQSARSVLKSLTIIILFRIIIQCRIFWLLIRWLMWLGKRRLRLEMQLRLGVMGVMVRFRLGRLVKLRK